MAVSANGGRLLGGPKLRTPVVLNLRSQFPIQEAALARCESPQPLWRGQSFAFGTTTQKPNSEVIEGSNRDLADSPYLRVGVSPGVAATHGGPEQ